MPAVLANTTTTDKYTDTVLGGDRPYSGGVLVVANNPVSILYQHGADRGTFSSTEYPYVAPTTIPLVRGDRETIIGLQIKSAIPGTPAQVYGYLVEPGVAGLGVGTPFTQAISSSGLVSSNNVVTGIILANGNPYAGTGYSSVRTGAGRYTITFTTPFAATPAINVEANTATPVTVILPTIAANMFTVAFDTPAGVATDAVMVFSAQAVA